MQITFATPALLFPAISLLLLAFTNKFLAIANLIRNLHDRYEKENQPILRECFVCMFLLFWGKPGAATWVFVGSLLLMIVSLVMSLTEIWISAGALRLLLKDFEEDSSNGA
jgi:Protein of unknown function (DUF2721)